MLLVITLHPNAMQNPDLDIRYVLPDLLCELSEGQLRSDGYDYTDDRALEIFLTCEPDLNDPVTLVKRLLVGRKVLGNDVALIAEFRTES